jgi:hypothetical protein
MNKNKNLSLGEKHPALLKEFFAVMASKNAEIVAATVRAAYQLLQRESRHPEDLINTFIAEHCLVDPRAEVSAKDLYHGFSKYWKENVDGKVPSQKFFGTEMGKVFTREKSGVYRYLGISLNIT